MYTCRKVLSEQRIRIRFIGVAKRSVKRPATVEVVVPGNRVIVSMRAPFVGLFVQRHQHFEIALQIFEIIPFVEALPFARKVARGWMFAIHHLHSAVLWLGMSVE